MNRRQFLVLAASGFTCASSLNSQDVLRAADGPIEMRDLIVVVPGILGSTLSVKGQPIWAPTLGGVDRLLISLWQQREGLFLAKDSPEAEHLDDGVTADTLMPDIHLVPGLWKVDGYSQLRLEIAQAFKISPGANYIEFPYDWRRDNRAAARRLKRLSDEWLTSWRKRSANPQAKLVLICHSMGGLIARYFLESLEGWRDTRALITFGTPYQGAVKALEFIANGYRQDLTLGGQFELSSISTLLQSFTSIYQLLPTYKCIADASGTLLAANELSSIPNVDMIRLHDAFGFHGEINQALQQNAKDQQYQNSGYTICPVVGIEQPTLVSARSENNRITTIVQRGILGGDGTVPRVSAKPANVPATYVAELHASLQNSPISFGQVEGFLTEAQFILKGAETERLELDSADAFSSTEPVVMRAYPHNFAPPVRLTARVTESLQQKIVRSAQMEPDDDGWYKARFEPIPLGTYRVTVAAGDKTVTDVFVVL